MNRTGIGRQTLAGWLALGGMGFLLAAPVAAQDPALQVIINHSSSTVTMAQLKEWMNPATVTVYNPVYERIMSYDGFWLNQLLAALHVDLEEEDLIFQSADGYATSLVADEVGQKKWLLAYIETGGLWTPLPHRTSAATPAPWYLIGISPESFKETPWPYQVTTVKAQSSF